MPEGECGEAKEGKARQGKAKAKASRAFVCMCNAAGGEAEGRKVFMAEESRLGLDTNDYLVSRRLSGYATKPDQTPTGNG